MKVIVKKIRIAKLISAFFIILILAPIVLFSNPENTYATVPVADPVGHGFLSWIGGSSGVSAGATATTASLGVKEVAKEIIRQAIMAVERKLLAEMTKSMVNWINSGFHGSPLFLENPASFFRDIEKYEIKTLIDVTGYNSDEVPFGKDFALNIIDSYKRKLKDNAQYSLSKATTDPILLKKYREDFDFGGWNGFLINSQYPQNNVPGYYMIATEELARRLDGMADNNVKKVQNTLSQGMGFLSPQTCPSNPLYNNLTNEFRRPSFKFTEKYDPPLQGDMSYEEWEREWRDYDARYKARQDAARTEWSKTNTCPGGLVNTTPGSVVANQITTAMSSNFRQTELGAAVGSSMSAIFDALLNHFLDKGLNSLASKANPTPKPDDWTYEGRSLAGPGDNEKAAWDAGPDEVIILSEFKEQINGKIIGTCDIPAPGIDQKDVTELECRKIVGGTCSVLGQTNPEDCTRAGGTWDVPSGTVWRRNEPGKDVIPGDIANTQTELAMMDSNDPNNPYTATVGGVCSVDGKRTYADCLVGGGAWTKGGILQKINEIWPKTRELDMCVPGLKLGWQERLDKEKNRNAKQLNEKMNDNDGKKAAMADLSLKELNFAVDFFKDWINNKMILELPNSVIYIDSVKEIETLQQQTKELTDKRRARTQALARLKAIKINLDNISTQPASGSAQEKVLVQLKKQYNAVRPFIASTSSIEDSFVELNVLKDKLIKLSELVTQCTNERTAAGWNIPSNGEAGWGTWNVSESSKNGVSEKSLFCEAPIVGGYNHETFKNDTPDTHPEIPLVNAEDVLKWDRWGWWTGNYTADIRMQCDLFYNSNVLDYKKDLPGPTAFYDNQGPSPLGTCNYAVTGMTQSECSTNGGAWNSSNETCSFTTHNVTEVECSANNGTWSSSGDLSMPASTTVSVGGTFNLNISGGSPSYSIQTIPFPSVATATISGNTIIITGVGAGQTLIVVQDSSNPSRTGRTYITVN